MQIKMRGQRVLVTAGASGIGLAIGSAFARSGARVRVCDIDETQLARIRQDGIEATRADVASAADIDALYELIRTEWGGLDVLVNNAGIAGPTKAIEDVTEAEWDKTLAVNLTGQFLCIRRAVPLMKAQGGGCIINLSSVAGRIGMPLRVPYSATKYAVRGMTDALAIELGQHNIRVNALMPGLVDGSRGRQVVEEQAAAAGMDPAAFLSAMLHNVSLATMIAPDEIAAMAVYLASDFGRHISGQSIGICGNFESYRSPLNIRSTNLSFSDD